MTNSLRRAKQLRTLETGVWQTGALVVIGFYTLITITPLVWMILTAFRPHPEIVRNVFGLPDSLYLDNFVTTWKVGGLGGYILNSIFYSVVSTVITVYLALSTGFALTKFPYKANRVVYIVYISGAADYGARGVGAAVSTGVVAEY